MKNLREKIVEIFKKAKESGSAETEALEMLLVELKATRKDPNWLQHKVRSILEKFCCIFMACLTNLRSGQPLENLSEIVNAFKTKEEEIQKQFVNGVLARLCVQADAVAIDVAAYFFHSSFDSVASAARELLTKVGLTDQGKELVTKSLLGHVSKPVGAVTVLAKINPKIGAEQAFKLFRNKELQFGALSILTEMPLEKEIVKKTVDFLQSHEAHSLWDSLSQRMACYAFLQYVFESGLLLTVEARPIISKAFRHECAETGIKHLLSVIAIIDPKNEQIIFEGFIAMETSGENHFSARRDKVKEFISKLKGSEKVEYLKRTLIGSTDEEFMWFAGKMLMLTDLTVATETFLEIAKKKSLDSPRLLAVLTQRAVKMCSKKEHTEKEDDGKSLRSRFAPVARRLFAYAKSADCPTGKRLEIAVQPLMFGGHAEFCREAIAILEDVLLCEGLVPAQVQKALQAMFNCQVQRKMLSNEVDAVLTKVYASEYKERFLKELLDIIASDVRGYPMEPLYPPIVNFLVKIPATEAVPILEKALASKRPDGDLGLCARASYINGLKKFAIEGSVKAVGLISRYRGGNICSEFTPAVLPDIYQKTTSDEIKKEVIDAVIERFLISIKDSYTVNRICYFYEIRAIEALKKEPLIQEAFLKGISSIGKGDISPGMCGLIDKVSEIMPKERIGEAKEILCELTKNLKALKAAYIDKYQMVHRGISPRSDDSRVGDIETICAQIYLVLASM